MVAGSFTIVRIIWRPGHRQALLVCVGDGPLRLVER